jgi:hypothetical protein
MSKYAEYDVKLLSLIAGGCNTFTSLVTRLRDDNRRIQPPPDSFRVTDRRLQALRKAGKIYYDRDRQEWLEVIQAPAAPIA